jgi:hypothetical protein
MPEIYLNVRVKKSSPQIEKLLGEHAEIKGKFESINLYMLKAKIKSTKNVEKHRQDIISSISKEPYVVNVEESAEVEIL